MDRRGTPLAGCLTGANVPDGAAFELALEAVEPLRRAGPGRPRRRPAKLHADKAYDRPHCHRYLRRRGIGDRIARIGIEPRDRLGRHRWVVGRTLAWLARFRRLTIRYERLADVHLAFLDLACALICLRLVERPFC